MEDILKSNKLYDYIKNLIAQYSRLERKHHDDRKNMISKKILVCEYEDILASDKLKLAAKIIEIDSLNISEHAINNDSIEKIICDILNFNVKAEDAVTRIREIFINYKKDYVISIINKILFNINKEL